MKKQNPLLALVPMLFVLVMTIWAMFNNLLSFINDKNYTLVILSVLVIFLTAWLMFSGFIVLFRKNTRQSYKFV